MATCPVCSDAGAQGVANAGVYELCLCLECQIRFSSPMKHPGQGWYEESDIYKEVQWNIPRLSTLGKRWEFKQALNYLDRSMDGVLDIGCGRGDFLKLAQLKGLRVYGIDLNPALLRVAAEVYGIETTEAGSFDDFAERRPEASFGAITAFEVLEHLPNPQAFVKKCRRLLKDHGRLIMSVPGYHRWPHWVNSPVDLPPHHLTLWTEKALRKIFESNGFSRITTLRKPLLVNDLMYHAVRKIPPLQAPGLIPKGFRGLIKIPLYVVNAFLKLNPKAGGFTILAVGQK